MPTQRFPFKNQEVQWLGTIASQKEGQPGPEDYQLFALPDEKGHPRIAGVFGTGQWEVSEEGKVQTVPATGQAATVQW